MSNVIADTIGTIVVDEILLNITHMRFHTGRLFLHARSRERVTIRSAEGVTDIEFFGDDGSWCGSVRTRVPAFDAVDGYIYLELPIAFTELTGTP